MSIPSLLMLDILIGILAAGLLVASLYSLWLHDRNLTANLDVLRTERNAQYDETMTLLRLVRDLATSARDNRHETAVAVSQVKEAVEQISSKPDWRGHESQPEQ